MSDLTALTLAQARDLLRKREFSAVALTNAHMAAMGEARTLNAFVLETPDHAQTMAVQADAALARGDAGPLAGIPLGIKDMFATAGVRTTACSHMLDSFVPTYESTVTANLWRAGAVMLGKLNNDEFAMGSSTETSCFGPAISPWRRAGSNAKLVPGGSSGGSAAAVAANLLPRRRRHRHRRVDPSAGGLHGYRRHQADLWPLLALGHRRLRILARSGRPVRPHRAGRRHSAGRDGRARRQGYDLGRSSGAGL